MENFIEKELVWAFHQKNLDRFFKMTTNDPTSYSTLSAIIDIAQELTDTLEKQSLICKHQLVITYNTSIDLWEQRDKKMEWRLSVVFMHADINTELFTVVANSTPKKFSHILEILNLNLVTSIRHILKEIVEKDKLKNSSS